MNQETKNKMAKIIAAAREKQIKASTIENVVNIAPVEEMEQKAATPIETQNLTIKELKIIWHEGHHDKAFFEGAIFTNLMEAQKAFFKLWEVNEKGQDGGYTKVKVEVSFNEITGTHSTRVDITNKIDNGDFNPTQEHIFNYLKKEIDSDTESGNYLLDCKENLFLIEETKESEELSTITIADLLGETKEEDNHPTTGVNCTQTPFELVAIVPTTKTAAAPSKIGIVDYSEKAFALVGDTKPIKDKLKELGGRFNPSLKCGAGWIFSKKHLEAVKKAIN